MEDQFASLTRDEFGRLLGTFASSMTSEFAGCAECAEWKEWLEAQQGDMDGVARLWLTSVSRPLQKGTAKYIKALRSIAGRDTTLRDAVHYHDVPAIQANAPEAVGALKLSEKFDGMSEGSRQVVWKFLEEIDRLAHRVCKEEAPRIPTVEEISEDIKARRARDSGVGGRGSSSKAPFGPGQGKALHQGLVEMWNKLCALREVRHELSASDILSRLEGRSATSSDLQAAFPELGDAPYTAEQLDLGSKMVHVRTMEAAIPSNMMRGIESAAHDLMQKLESGEADMSKLNLADIGQQVLTSVSPSDVSAFAGNIDKLLPVLQNFNMNGP